MGFFDRILGRQKDPTAEWPPFSLPIPEYDMSEMRFGALGFGDEMAKAAFLGKPDSVNWIAKDLCEMQYRRGGFYLYFDEGKFTSVAFFIAPSDSYNEGEVTAFSEPVLRGSVPYGTKLTSAVDIARIHALFGPPEEVEETDEDHTLYYEHNGADMEFDLDGNGKLTGWTVSEGFSDEWEE